jgi:RHS repeat-associated protein
MSSTDETLLCRYHYDPLDRLADCTPSAQARTQRFYLKERLTSEIQGSVQRSIFQQDDQLLAQQQRQDGVVETTLLGTDPQRSVLHALDATQPHPLAYTPYGHHAAQSGLLSLLGFNGERPDPVTGHYLLGNGYRAFNPVLMRFNSPDNLSPFGKGGLNGYGYCAGDPVNRSDPTGHIPNFLKPVLRRLRIIRRPPPATTIDIQRWNSTTTIGTQSSVSTTGVYGITLPASPDIKDILASPTEEFLILPIGPEHEILRVDTIELKLWKANSQIIQNEKFLAKQLNNPTNFRSKIEELRQLIQTTLEARAAYKANLHRYQVGIKQMTNEAFQKTSFFFTSPGEPPTYEWTMQHSRHIRNQT